jgi:hypothetical protein
MLSPSSGVEVTRQGNRGLIYDLKISDVFRDGGPQSIGVGGWTRTQ